MSGHEDDRYGRPDAGSLSVPADSDGSRRRAGLSALLLMLVLLPLYIIGGRWGLYGNPDVIATAAPAWQFANEGTLNLAEHPIISNNLDRGLDTWFIEVGDGQIYSNRPPGLIGVAVPAYHFVGSGPFSNGPATAVAIILTTLAVLTTVHIIRPFVGIPFAFAVGLVLGLGTTTWTISAAQLWPHGPGQLWAAAALLALSNERDFFAGVWFAAAILTRPITAVMAFIVGVGETIRKRSFPTLLIIGALSATGVLVLMLYNHQIFGSWSIRGGYSEAFNVERYSASAYLRNLLDMFVGYRGVLTSSPIIGIATYAAIRFRSELPGWAKTGALAALGYLVVHAALNRASGGAILFYRYPLEPIVMASAALGIGAYHLWKAGSVARTLLMGSALLSIALQAANVLYFSCWLTVPVHPACILG